NVIIDGIGNDHPDRSVENVAMSAAKDVIGRARAFSTHGFAILAHLLSATAFAVSGLLLLRRISLAAFFILGRLRLFGLLRWLVRIALILTTGIATGGRTFCHTYSTETVGSLVVCLVVRHVFAAHSVFLFAGGLGALARITTAATTTFRLGGRVLAAAWAVHFLVLLKRRGEDCFRCDVHDMAVGSAKDMIGRAGNFSPDDFAIRQHVRTRLAPIPTRSASASALCASALRFRDSLSCSIATKNFVLGIAEFSPSGLELLFGIGLIGIG